VVAVTLKKKSSGVRDARCKMGDGMRDGAGAGDGWHEMQRHMMHKTPHHNHKQQQQTMTRERESSGRSREEEAITRAWLVQPQPQLVQHRQLQLGLQPRRRPWEAMLGNRVSHAS